MLLDLAAFIGVWLAPLWPIIVLAKKRITIPRISRSDARLSGPSPTQLPIVGVVLGLMLLFTLGLVAFVLSGPLPELQAWVTRFDGPFLGLLGAIGVALTGWATGARRFYAYALLPVAAATSSYWTSLEFPVYLTLNSGIPKRIPFSR